MDESSLTLLRQQERPSLRRARVELARPWRSCTCMGRSCPVPARRGLGSARTETVYFVAFHVGARHCDERGLSWFAGGVHACKSAACHVFAGTCTRVKTQQDRHHRHPTRQPSPTPNKTTIIYTDHRHFHSTVRLRATRSPTTTLLDGRHRTSATVLRLAAVPRQ